MSGNEGIARLTRAHIGIVKEHAPAPLTWISLGLIQPDGSVLVDGYPDAWPIGSYLVLEQALVTVTSAIPLVPISTDSQLGGPNAHAHTVPPFAEYLPYAAGDRVLVALIQDKTVAVVIGRARPARLPV